MRRKKKFHQKEITSEAEVVVFLDYLGIKNKCTDELKEWLQQRNRIISIVENEYKTDERNRINAVKKNIVALSTNGMSNNLNEYKKLPIKTRIKVQEALKNEIVEMKVDTFQDTIMLTFPIGKIENIKDIQAKKILPVRNAIMRIINLSIEKGYLIRGAMSMGEFLYDDEMSTIVGEAVNDAHKYHEKGNWCGLVVTPSARPLIEKLFNELGDNNNYNKNSKGLLIAKMSFFDCPVPQKDNQSETFYCAGWPIDYFLSEYKNFDENPIEAKEHLIELVSKIKRDHNDPNIEEKYKNTIEFIEQCFNPEFLKNVVDEKLTNDFISSNVNNY